MAPKCSGWFLSAPQILRMTSQRMLDKFGIFFTVGAVTKNETKITYFILLIKYT